MNQLESILSNPNLVEWQGIGEHVTSRGKVKAILTGIPNEAFWRVWKRCKGELRTFGLTVSCSQSTGTGEFFTHKGKTREKKTKEWEVTIWLNKHNRQAVRNAGFELPVEELPGVTVELGKSIEVSNEDFPF